MQSVGVACTVYTQITRCIRLQSVEMRLSDHLRFCVYHWKYLPKLSSGFSLSWDKFQFKQYLIDLENCVKMMHFFSPMYTNKVLCLAIYIYRIASSSFNSYWCLSLSLTTGKPLPKLVIVHYPPNRVVQGICDRPLIHLEPNASRRSAGSIQSTQRTYRKIPVSLIWLRMVTTSL